MAEENSAGEQPEAKKPESKEEKLNSKELSLTELERSLASPTRPRGRLYDREALEQMSKGDLVDIILRIQAAGPRRTGRITPSAASISFDTSAEVKEYTRLPVTPKRKHEEEEDTTWRFMLISAESGHAPLGLEIYDDVIIGRAVLNHKPDLDLTKYNAEKFGVSRQHALFRPTNTSLFLIDLGSTNGTFCNSVKLGPGIAQKVKDGDTITLAGLHFLISIVQQPKTKPKKPTGELKKPDTPPQKKPTDGPTESTD